jgi:hypothetical protein
VRAAQTRAHVEALLDTGAAEAIELLARNALDGGQAHHATACYIVAEQLRKHPENPGNRVHED